MVPENLLMLIAVVGAGYVIGRLLKHREHAKEEAVEIAARLRKYGLDEIPKLFELWSQNDVKGFIDQLKYVARVTRNEAMLQLEFNEVLDKQLANPVTRAMIVSKINATAPNPPPSGGVK